MCKTMTTPLSDCPFCMFNRVSQLWTLQILTRKTNSDGLQPKRMIQNVIGMGSPFWAPLFRTMRWSFSPVSCFSGQNFGSWLRCELTDVFEGDLWYWEEQVCHYSNQRLISYIYIYIYTSVTKISTRTNTPTEQRNSEPYLGASCPLRTHIRLCHISLRHFESNKEIWHGWPVTSLCSFYVCRREGIYTLTHL